MANAQRFGLTFDELDCGNFKGRELTARRFCPQVSVSLVALAAACLAPSIAWAIGPQYQVVGDPVPPEPDSLTMWHRSTNPISVRMALVP